MSETSDRSSESSMESVDIALPGGAHVPAALGKYRVTPAPDLNEVTADDIFLLEYDFPILTVRDRATKRSSQAEYLSASVQVGDWSRSHPRVGATGASGRHGFQFNELSTRQSSGYHCQFIPDLYYIDETTWAALTADDKDKAYTPCVPTVVVELLISVDVPFEGVKTKMTKFMKAGTREGVIVDTRNDRIWICNQGEEPYCTSLAPVEFDSWPRFTLDCIAVREERERTGLID